METGFVQQSLQSYLPYETISHCATRVAREETRCHLYIGYAL